MRRTPSGLILPIAVATLAVASLIGGWMSFTIGSPTPVPETDGGVISVLTDDPEAQIDVDLSLPLKFDEIYEDQLPPVILDVSVRRSTTAQVRWAILLVGDAALPYSLTDAAGDALPRGGRRGFDQVWVQGDVESATYYRNARTGRPGEVEERVGNASESVLAGTSSGAKTFAIHVVGPSEKPLLIDTGPQQYTNFPVMGAPGVGTAEDGQAFLVAAHGRSVRALIAEGGRDTVDPRAAAFLESTTWYYPTTYDLTAHLSDQQPADRLSQVEPPPIAPLDWTWHATGRLFVRGTVDQPDWQASAPKFQFLGGVLAGIGGGLLVWAAELAYASSVHRPAGVAKGQLTQ
jgi:hypothetical protein